MTLSCSLLLLREVGDVILKLLVTVMWVECGPSTRPGETEKEIQIILTLIQALGRTDLAQ